MRYVVLQFDDNDRAEHFATGLVNASDGKAVALVPAPTQFCECVPRKGTQQGYTKGKKYGWWVCSRCKKPTKAWGDGYRAVVGSGKNLLPQEEA